LPALLAVAQFYQSRTTIHPDYPGKTTSLVTGGVYRFTRNPMYLGLLLLLLGLVIYLGNLYGTLSLVILVTYITRYKIRSEERKLLANFGDDYANYCVKVRR